MSAEAHNNIDESNIASMQLNTEPAVTSISVTARIDYIQRFSKQTVLVIDNDPLLYSQAARQFLTNLSNHESTQEANVAFVSASSKLNDIQMRCRLIEQLFANTLFDPEKSLAVSVLTLSKQSKESITIVVEHAHALSLQIQYELCQLVDVANKTQHKINVALFGDEQAAQTVATNKSIFKNKLAIIEAKTGQLIPLDHAKFNRDNAVFTNKFWLKIATAVSVIIALIALSWFVLINYDNFSLSQLPTTNIKTTDNNLALSNDKKRDNAEDIFTNKAVVTQANELAKVDDIHAALLGGRATTFANKNIAAKASDILQALDVNKEDAAFETLETVAVKAPELVEPEELTTKDMANKPTHVVLPLALTPHYYLNTPAGYVVQIVGFSNLTLLKRFMKTYPNLQYFSYQKKLDNKTFIVLTTKIFDNKEQANKAIATLPQDVIDRGVWVKSLALIQAEINTH